MMDTSMAPAATTMDRQLTTQQVSNAMAGPVAAAAGRFRHRSRPRQQQLVATAG